MIISLEYSYKIFLVDKFYQTINNPDIAMRVELVDLVIHYDESDTKVPIFDNWQNWNYFKRVIEYARSYYRKNRDKCDHVFWVENYEQNGVMGEAYVGEICNYGENKFTSHIRHHKFVELILGHEMGHNLGANHDGENNTMCSIIETHKVMWRYMVKNYTAHKFSECSVKQFVRTLLDVKTKKLKEKFKCLEKKNYAKSKNIFR